MKRNTSLLLCKAPSVRHVLWAKERYRETLHNVFIISEWLLEFLESDPNFQRTMAF